MKWKLPFIFLPLILLGLFQLLAPLDTYYLTGQASQPRDKVSLELAIKKGCLSCHEGIEDINPKMIASGVNCITCHLGNPLATTKKEAHKGMYINPSDFRIIDYTCGQCHGEKSPFPIKAVVSQGEKNHVERMKRALMTTAAGEISGVRYLFGEQNTKKAIFGIRKVDPIKKVVKGLEALPSQASSHSDNMLRHECLSCHLWTKGIAKKGMYRSSGCAACHVLYSDEGTSRSKDPTILKGAPGHPIRHEITTKIPTKQCLHCHNLGPGRMIGLSYVGLSLKGLAQEEIYGTSPIHLEADLHHLKGLSCIDCHNTRDLHGDGRIYNKMEDQVAVRCETCHGTLERLPSLRNARGERLKNLWMKNGEVFRRKKMTAEVVRVPLLSRLKALGILPPAMIIPSHMKEIKGRLQLECYACHSPKATQCYGCHLKRDDRKFSTTDWGRGLRPKAVGQEGKWNWSLGYLRWEKPVLGINHRGRVSPYIPGGQPLFTYIDRSGRILSLNLPLKFSMNPINPHTTTRKVRSCESCHTDPKAVGLGSRCGIARFLNLRKSLESLVSEDGKILQDILHPSSRPFNSRERARINRGNLCIACHKEMWGEETWKKTIAIYGRALENKTHKDILNQIFRR